MATPCKCGGGRAVRFARYGPEPRRPPWGVGGGCASRTAMRPAALMARIGSGCFGLRLGIGTPLDQGASDRSTLVSPVRGPRAGGSIETAYGLRAAALDTGVPLSLAR